MSLKGCRDHDGRGHGALTIGRDERPHKLDQLGGEERVEGEVVDRHRPPLMNCDLPESCSLELVDEVTLRQGSGHSAGPRCRVGQDLGRERLVTHRQI